MLDLTLGILTEFAYRQRLEDPLASFAALPSGFRVSKLSYSGGNQSFRRKRLLTAGICPVCGNAPLNGFSRCQSCRDRANAAHRARTGQRQRPVRGQRPQRPCSRCRWEEAMPGRSRCAKCREKGKK